jgi:methionyl-tRNA formyltransferase
VERAVLAGDTETAVCVMALDEGMDTGPVYECASTPIDPTETAGELTARLVTLGTPLLVDVLADLPSRVPTPQRGEPTHAAKLSVEEFRLDWSRDATALERTIRAGNPRPGAWTTIDGRRLKVVRARATDAGVPGPPGRVDSEGRVATGDGALQLLEVQPEGRPPMPARAWLAGRRDAVQLGPG